MEGVDHVAAWNARDGTRGGMCTVCSYSNESMLGLLCCLCDIRGSEHGIFWKRAARRQLFLPPMQR